MSYDLFVDESGAFEGDEKQAKVLVCGLWVSARRRAQLDRKLKGMLGSRFPFVPWPLHTAHLHNAGYLALAWHAWAASRRVDELETRLRGMGLSVSEVDADATARALGRLAGRESDELFLDFSLLCADRPWALRGGMLYAARFARAARQAVEQDPRRAAPIVRELQQGRRPSLGACRAFAKAVWPGPPPSAVARFRRRALAELNTAYRQLPKGSAVFLAAESEPFDAEPDRYLALLGVLAERVAAVDRGDEATLRVQARDIPDPDHDELPLRPLTEGDLRRATEGVEGLDWVGYSLEHWHDQPGRPRGRALTGVTLSGGQVLVDAAAYQLRHRLDGSLDQLRDFVELQLRLDAATGPRSHFAASGRARVPSEGAGAAGLSDVRPWAAGQATTWA